MCRKASARKPRGDPADRCARRRSAAARCRVQLWFDPYPAFSKAALPPARRLDHLSLPPDICLSWRVRSQRSRRWMRHSLFCSAGEHHPFGQDDASYSGMRDHLSAARTGARNAAMCVPPSLPQWPVRDGPPIMPLQSNPSWTCQSDPCCKWPHSRRIARTPWNGSDSLPRGEFVTGEGAGVSIAQP